MVSKGWVRFGWVIVAACFIAGVSTLMHEGVHVLQCEMLNGTPRLTYVYSNGYDFLNVSFGDELPSPATACLNMTQDAVRMWKGNGDWDSEGPAFAMTGVGFSVMLGALIAGPMRRRDRKRGGRRSMTYIFLILETWLDVS